MGEGEMEGQLGKGGSGSVHSSDWWSNRSKPEKKIIDGSASILRMS